jgi:hypothetical protein
MSVWVGVTAEHTVCGAAFGDDSIYIESIRMNGLPLLDAKAQYSWGQTARDAMHTRQLIVLTLTGETVESVELVLSQTSFKVSFILSFAFCPPTVSLSPLSLHNMQVYRRVSHADELKFISMRT